MSLFEPDPNRRHDRRPDGPTGPGQPGSERETGPGQPGSAVAPYRQPPVPDSYERARSGYPPPAALPPGSVGATFATKSTSACASTASRLRVGT